VALLVVGAPIYLRAVEDDLERRVPDEIADAGLGVVVARFSGQSGTLSCEIPLAAPQDALNAAYDVSGVRSVELDRSCRVNTSGVGAATMPEGSDDTSGGAEAGSSPDASGSGTAADAASGIGTGTGADESPDFASIASVLSTDPQFSLLWVLVGEAGLDEMLSDAAGDPVTLFAPTNEAFDALPADVIAEVRSDPDLLTEVLRHHMAGGRLSSAGMITGPLSVLDGGTVDVVVDADGVMVDDSTITWPDIESGNGVVHAIDAVLVPSFHDLGPVAPVGVVSATLDDTVITLVGIVASDTDRERLVTAAGGDGDDGDVELVVDHLVVDEASGVPESAATALVDLIGALRTHMDSGVVAFDGDSLSIVGTAPTTQDRDAAVAVADATGATSEIEAPAVVPTATAEQAEELEGRLNALVSATPITFAPSAADLPADSSALLDQLATELVASEGVVTTIEGHTDSDGVANDNRTLSQRRADAVLFALVARGVDGAAVASTGFGSERPILVDGVEDKQASRRVEFSVEVAT
jgi:outer membrane protein OmpA-like peptidoglycan-associated protein/uncharacterized surface protein with fasciclin (FAS1) repeats